MPSLPWGELSGWALAGALFLSMMTGLMVPLRTVRREQALLEKEADAWRKAHDTEAAQLGVILAELRSRLPSIPPAQAQPGRWEDPS